MKKAKEIKFYEIIFENRFMLIIYFLLAVCSFFFFIRAKIFWVNVTLLLLFGFSYFLLFYHNITDNFFTNILEKLGLKVVKVQYLELISYGIFSFYIFIMTYFLYKYANSPFATSLIVLFVILTVMTIAFFLNEAKKCMFTYPQSLMSELSASEKIAEFSRFLNTQENIESADILKRIENDFNKKPELKKEIENIAEKYFTEAPLIALIIFSYYVMKYDNLKNQIYYTLYYSLFIPLTLLTIFRTHNLIFIALIILITVVVTLLIHPYIRRKMFLRYLQKNMSDFFKSTIVDELTKVSSKDTINSKNRKTPIHSELSEAYKHLGMAGLSKESQFFFFLTIVIIISLFLILLNAVLCVQISAILNKSALHDFPNFLNIVSDGMASFIGFILPESSNYILKFAYTLILIEGKIYFLVLLGFILTKANKLTD